jgi:hypothetical protein
LIRGLEIRKYISQISNNIYNYPAIRECVAQIPYNTIEYIVPRSDQRCPEIKESIAQRSEEAFPKIKEDIAQRSDNTLPRDQIIHYPQIHCLESRKEDTVPYTEIR